MKKAEDLAKLEGSGLYDKFVTTYKPKILQDVTMLQQFYAQKALAKKLEGIASPTFNFENHKGGMTKLEDFKGKYVYIDVWATWCAPCRAEIPYLKKIEENYHNDDIVFVRISVVTQ